MVCLAYKSNQIDNTHLLVENGLGLTSITLLLHIVSTLSYVSPSKRNFYPEVSEKPYRPCTA